MAQTANLNTMEGGDKVGNKSNRASYYPCDNTSPKNQITGLLKRGRQSSRPYFYYNLFF